MRDKGTWCPAVCLVVPEEQGGARNLQVCAPCCSITVASSCKDQLIPLPNWRACVPTRLPYIHSLSICSELEPGCKLAHLNAANLFAAFGACRNRHAS